MASAVQVHMAKTYKPPDPCLWLHQSRLSLLLVGSQKALVVLRLCLQSLEPPEQGFVAGLDEGEVQGGALSGQTGSCTQAVPSEAPGAAQVDLSFK